MIKQNSEKIVNFVSEKNFKEVLNLENIFYFIEVKLILVSNFMIKHRNDFLNWENFMNFRVLTKKLIN